MTSATAGEDQVIDPGLQLHSEQAVDNPEVVVIATGQMLVCVDCTGTSNHEYCRQDSGSMFLTGDVLIHIHFCCCCAQAGQRELCNGTCNSWLLKDIAEHVLLQYLHV